MCPISLNQGRLTWRHISVLSMLLSRLHDDIIQNSIQGNLCRYFLYFFYIYLPLEGAFRPIFSPPANVMISSSLMLLKRIILMELTVPFEMNINDAHSRKMDRYGSLVADLQTAGYKPELTCVEIGSRRLIIKVNKSRIKSVFKFTGRVAVEKN